MDKICSKCEIKKELSCFYNKKSCKFGVASICKKCSGDRRRDQNSRKALGLSPLPKKRVYNIELHDPEYKYHTRLKRIYGISIDEYNTILSNQNNCCAICNRHQIEFKKRMHVDHCHKTGKVRGLLCSNCNQGIGHFYENINFLKNSIKYLEITNK